MLNEHSRELKYTAQLAGIIFETAMLSDSIGFKLFCYNDSYHQFFVEVFKEIKSFQPTKSFYDDKRKGLIRAFKNA